MTQLATFLVYRLIEGEWKFWMFARGKSPSQVRQSIVWRNKNRIPRHAIRVIEGSIPEEKE